MKEIKNIVVLIDSSGSLYTVKAEEFLKQLSQKNASNISIHAFDTHISRNLMGEDLETTPIGCGCGTDIHRSIKEACALYPNTQEIILITDFYDTPLSIEESKEYEHIEFILIDFLEAPFFKNEASIDHTSLKNLPKPIISFSQNMTNYCFESFDNFLPLLEEKMSHNIELKQLESSLQEHKKLKSKKVKV